MKRKNTNTLQELLLTFPDQDWCWWNISCNPNIDIQFVKKNLHFPWDWTGLSQNTNITENDINKNIRLPWDWGTYGISKNLNISSDFVLKNLNKPWDWNIINERTCENVLGQIYNYSRCLIGSDNYEEDTDVISEIDENEILQNFDKFDNIDWSEASRSRYVSQEFIEKCLTFPWDWDWYGLSRNPNIQEDFIKKYINKNWNWEMLSKNTNIRFDFIFENLDKSWNWGNLSRSPYINEEVIERGEKLGITWIWDCWGLSNNPNVTTRLVKKYLNKNWDWKCLSSNLFKLDNRYRPPIPVVSESRKKLLEEMREYFSIPPHVDKRSIFNRGGVLFLEDWDMIKRLNLQYNKNN